MNFQEYQDLAGKTAAHQGSSIELAVLTLGLAGEVGEVVELVKKHLGHGKPLPAAVIMDELSDVLWYIASLASYFNLGLEGIAIYNIKKLEKRYPNGFEEGGGIR